MNTLHCLLAILRADLTLRLRSPRFWVVLGLLALASWSIFPGPGGYMTAVVNGQYRATYSSAWVGMLLALTDSLLLSLAGFYVIRGNITRDIDTRVWQLLMTTTMTRRTYLFAKWCSNLAALLLMAAIGLATGLFMQWLRAEDRAIDLLEAIKPLIVLSLPMLALTAACAVWFDMLPPLRRSAGNVLFFILWLTCISLGASGSEEWKGAQADSAFTSDPGGMAVFMRDLKRNVAPQLPKHDIEGFCLGCGESEAREAKVTGRFAWRQWQPRAIDLPARLFWLVLAMASVAAAAPLLDWAAARAAAPQQADGKRMPRNRPLRLLTRALAPLQGSRLGMMFSAELLLVLRQRRKLWWSAALILGLLQLFAAADAAAVAVCLSWILSLDVLARAALRDEENGTAALLFTAPGATWRILAARWLTLLTLTWLFALPAVLHFAVTAPQSAAAILLVGLSLATWRMAFGALLRNPHPFELLLCLLVYAALNGSSFLNVAIDPLHTCILHATFLLPAVALLLWRWPHLAHQQR